MTLKWLILCFCLIFSSIVFAQTEEIEVNGYPFTIKQVVIDPIEQTDIELYRGDKKILTHTLISNLGDCSSIHLELGNYKLTGDSIIFYSYWASMDRMSSPMLPYGFREQIYTVDSLGSLKLTKASIYLESFADTENKNYLEDGDWVHKGLRYLNQETISEHEQQLVDDYIQSIENEYHADFVLQSEKLGLEQRVRKELSKEIEKHTGYWIPGEEAFGKVKK